MNGNSILETARALTKASCLCFGALLDELLSSASQLELEFSAARRFQLFFAKSARWAKGLARLGLPKSVTVRSRISASALVEGEWPGLSIFSPCFEMASVTVTAAEKIASVAREPALEPARCLQCELVRINVFAPQAA